MTKKKNASGKIQVKKLKIKKETLKDLEVKGKGVKGGIRIRSILTDCTCSCTPWCK